MFKDRLGDSIQLGIIAGGICNLPKIAIINIFQRLNLVQYNFAQMTAGIFINERALTHPLALLIGYIADFAVASLLGSLLVYIMKLTGKDYVLSKGALYGITLHIIVFGVAKTLGITSVELTSPLANFLVLIPNFIYGVLAAVFIRRYGIF